jgi:hypothetical protein
MSFAGYADPYGQSAATNSTSQSSAPSFLQDPVGWVEDAVNPTGSWNTLVNPPGQPAGSGGLFGGTGSGGSSLSNFLSIIVLLILLAIGVWIFK